MRDLIKIGAEFFVGTIGILYATGFLITFTFLERFGIREAGGEFFKLKYIYTGILYSLFPAAIAAPTFALLLLKQRARELARTRQDDLVVPVSTILLVLNMMFVFYIIVCFAPAGFARQRGWLVPTIFGVTIIGAVVFKTLEEAAFARHWFGKMGSWLRWSLFILTMLWLDRVAVHKLSGDLNAMFFGGGWYYFLLVALYLLVSWRITRRLTMHADLAVRINFLVIGIGVCASLFFFSILAFSARVYPFIPVAKGGGDFRKQSKAVVHFTNNASAEIVPPKLLDVTPEVKTRPVILIETTPSSVYVAHPNDVNEWRTGNVLPHVIEIRRDLISSIEYRPSAR